MALDDTNPADPLDPRACPTPVFRPHQTLLLLLETPWGVFLGAQKAPAGMGTRKNTVFKYLKTLGRVFGGIKSPCGNGDTHSLCFPRKNTHFSYGKTLGRVLGGIKSPCGNGHTHSLGFPNKNTFLFAKEKPCGAFLGAMKRPCGNGHTHSLVLGKDRSRTPVSNPVPPECVVRVPAHWAI